MKLGRGVDVSGKGREGIEVKAVAAQSRSECAARGALLAGGGLRGLVPDRGEPIAAVSPL
jgi:hypothetical protein